MVYGGPSQTTNTHVIVGPIATRREWDANNTLEFSKQAIREAVGELIGRETANAMWENKLVVS